ncbi:UNVERIFIED_CONTAM: hypothetical protein FKN15_033994 [Acipenser sinensis]
MHLTCRVQLPYLLLNSPGTEMKPRMYPVFFGESIEVKSEPAKEISTYGMRVLDGSERCSWSEQSRERPART